MEDKEIDKAAKSALEDADMALLHSNFSQQPETRAICRAVTAGTIIAQAAMRKNNLI